MNKYNNFYLRPTSVARNRSIPSLTDRPTSSQGLTYKPSREYLLQTPLPSSDLKHIDQNISLETPNHRQLDISIGQPNHHYSSHLSLLTLKANEQLKIKERHAYAQPKVLNRSSTQVSVKKVPGSQEIDKILDRLEKVANNQAGGMRKPVLKEAKPMHVIMEQGETQYFKIGVKGKNCPMRVSIKRNKGNYKIYASKTVSEPNEMLHDYAFRTDYFIISDIGLSFKFDSIYLGIVALENSSLEITVFFGKRGQEVDQNDNLFRSPGSVSFRAYRSKSSRKLEELMRNDTLRENLRRKAEEILNQRKAQAILLSGNKDFLKMNMAPLSPARLRASSATREMREQRRNEVKVRKENIVTERNIRLKTLMQRHDARKIEIEEEKKSRRLKETVDNCYKKWFSIIYFSKGIISILDHVRENRQSIIKRLVCNASARKIQRACRIIWANISVSKLKVLRARNNLLLYYSQCKPIIQITDSARIVKFIHEAATNFLIHRHFRSTYNKIISIQNNWRAYHKVNQNRWEHLIILWSQAVDKLLLQPRTGTKKTRKKKAEIKNYSLIPAAIRNQGPAVVESYLKKLKNVGAVMRFISKFTKRWFVLDLRSGKFYYTKNKNTAKAKETYNVNDLVRVERNPKVTEVCDWKFPFVIEFKAKTYIFYAESLSVHDLWCKAFIAILIPRYSHPQVMNPPKPETDYPQNSLASQGPRGLEPQYPSHPDEIAAGERRYQQRLNSPSKGGMRRDERNKFPSHPDDVEYYDKERPQHESPPRARQNSVDVDSRDIPRDKAEFRTQQPRMVDPRDFSEYPRNYPDEGYAGRAGYQEPVRQGYQDIRQYQGYQEPPRQGYQEPPRQGYQDSPTYHNQSPTRSTYQDSSHSHQGSPMRARQGSPARNPPESRQYQELVRGQYPEAQRQSYNEVTREHTRQSYEEPPRGNYDAPNPRMAYGENPRPNLPPAQSQYEDPKQRKSSHSRKISRDTEQTAVREVNTYSNKPRDKREPFETDIPSIPKSRHTQPADEETVLTKFNFPIKEDVKNIKRERLTRPGQDRGHDARDAKPSVQASSTRPEMPAPQNPVSKSSMGFNEVDLRESLNKGPAGMLDILEDMDGLGLPDKVDNWKGRGRGTMNMTVQGFNAKPQANYAEPVNLGGSQRIPRENFEGRGADYAREAYNEPVRNPSPYRERNMPYREQPPPYQEQPQYSRTYSDVRDSPPYTDQSSYSRSSSIRESQQYVEQPVYREKQTGYREQPQYYEEEPHARRKLSNSSYKEQPYREAPRVPSKYSETPVYNQSESSKPPPRAPAKYSETPVYIQPEPSGYKPQEPIYRKSSWNEEPQNQSLKAPSTVATGGGDADWDNWDD